MWLWNVKPTISFDEGYRVANFRSFENEQQFKDVAEALARRAAEQVLHLRAQFPTILAVSDYYIQNPPLSTFWPRFNAAIAHGLCSRSDAASKLLGSIVGKLDLSIEWQKNADSDAKYLAGKLHNREQFCRLIAERVLQTRKLQNLKPLDYIDFEVGLP
jgi:hypothetical protein